MADKVCALYERHGTGQKTFSSRARDLADLAMIAQQKGADGTELIEQVRREEKRRLDAGTLIEPLPTTLRLAGEQIADWAPRWTKATRGAPIALDEAQAVAAALLDPVLEGSATGRHWSAAEQAWV
jgi:nucleotidyltransferase AbiEii toxin of type IV toxin-antitoxin system